MSKRFTLLTAVIVVIGCALALRGQGQDPVQPTYMTAAELEAALRRAADPERGLTTFRISNTPHYVVSLQRRTKPLGAIVHKQQTEIHYIVDGAGMLVTGGALSKASGLTGDRPMTLIEGGENQRVAKGDVVVIPAGTPHWYSEVESTVTYLEVRWDNPVQ